MDKIDWSLAPEGATHYMPNTEMFCEAWIKDIKSNGYSYIIISDGCNEWDTATFSRPKAALSHLIEKPKPLYTTKMKEAGELPSVGMECLYKRFHQDDSNLLGCYIIGHSQDKCWLVFETVDDELLSHNIKNGTFTFKPLTPPIELIDGKAYQFNLRGVDFNGIYDKADKSFKFMNGNALLELVDNIQLLEVK